MRDFTLDQYRLLCEAFSEYDVYTVARYLEEKPSGSFIILRHDVDRSPLNALRMAELESELDVYSTYYFRCSNAGYPSEYIELISGLGHEIGYHYEVVSKTTGDDILSEKLFLKELSFLRELSDVKTVSMHGKPLSSYSNLDFWENRSFYDYSLLGDATLSIVEDSIFYLTDTGRNWNGDSNIRDYSDLSSIGMDIEDTGVVVNLLKQRRRYYFNIHPERWGYNLINWFVGYTRDILFNSGKKLIKSMRG